MIDKQDWTKPDSEGNITIPDRLDKLFNQLGIQLRFHTLSGKNEIITVAHMTSIADSFARSQSIEFIEWTNKCDYIWNARVEKWVRGLEYPPLTTFELFDIFWQKKQQEGKGEI